MTNPTLITTPFAENGDKNSIPETNTDPNKPQLASMSAGFPPVTQQKISEGGIPPERNDFNGILNLYGQHIVHLNKGLPYEFDQDFADAIGGYPLNARVMLDNGDIVRSTIANNTVNPNVDVTGWVKVNSATQIIDKSGKTQQEINDETTIFKAESETIAVPMINVIRDRIIVDTYAKAVDSSHLQAINRAILASRDYSQAAIHFNNHDYELDDTILLSNLNDLHMQFAGGRLVATTPSKNILAATGCNGLKFSDIKIAGLGAEKTQSEDEFGLLFISCNDLTLDCGQLNEVRGQAALRLLDSHNSSIRDLTIDRYSYAGLQILGTSKNTKVKGFKILNGLGALSSGASGYGVHISVGNDQFPELIFLEDFEIIGNNWDGINSHGSGEVFVRNGVIKEVKNGIEFAIDNRYSNSYLKNINFENVDIECFNSPWNTATQGAVTNLSSGLSIASADAGVRYCEGATIKNVNVKYANNSAGGTGDNAGIRLHGIKGLRVSGGSAKECKSQGMRLYGYIDDFAIRDFTAHDINGQGVLIGPNVSNGYVDDLKFGNSGTSDYTGLTAIQAGSTGTVNVVERNTQLTTSNVTKYSNTSGVQLRLKQESLDAVFDPNNAAYASNLAGFKVGDVIRSPTLYSGVLYSGWMCTAIDTVTPSMTWKRYGATV